MKSKTVYVILTIVVIVIAIAAFVYINMSNKNTSEISADMNASSSSGATQNANTDANSQSPAGVNVPQISGVKITVLKEGTGKSAQTGDTVSVNYTGKLSDGTVFDSNIDPKFSHVEPFTFSLGAGDVIRGWDEGVVGMKVGEERQLVISPDYAYGASGINGIIPPNATLTFDVTLLSIGNSSSQGTQGVSGQNSSGQ